MAEEKTKSLSELTEKRDALLNLREAIEKRITNLRGQERLEVESLSNRALNPQCAFDRKHSSTLYKLALVPNEVSWYFKLREKLHGIIHHH
jgi:hypothetical protein